MIAHAAVADDFDSSFGIPGARPNLFVLLEGERSGAQGHPAILALIADLVCQNS
jgi:hypothetical protein